MTAVTESVSHEKITLGAMTLTPPDELNLFWQTWRPDVLPSLPLGPLTAVVTCFLVALEPVPNWLETYHFLQGGPGVGKSECWPLVPLGAFTGPPVTTCENTGPYSKRLDRRLCIGKLGGKDCCASFCAFSQHPSSGLRRCRAPLQGTVFARERFRHEVPSQVP